MNVTVYHNETDGHYFGFEEGNTLTEVISYEEPGSGPYEDILEHCFMLFNIGDPDYLPADYAEVVREYREGKRARSLSVGDVVEINNVRFACDRAGWTRLS